MKKILSLVMAVVMVFSMIPTTAFAVEDTAVTETTLAPAETDSVAAEEAAPAEEKTEAPAEESTEAPTEESTEAPAEESTEAPAEENTEASAEESTEAPAEESTEAPTEESTEAPAKESAEAPTEAPAEDTVDAGKNPAAAGAVVPPENYLINDNDLMTRLRVDYDNQAEFQLGFKVRWDGEQTNRFTNQMGMNLLEKGRIRINDGREWTFPEAEMTFTTEKTRSSFHTYNKEFIKDFYEQDTFKITVITPEGYTVELDGVQNKMTQQEREAFKADMDPGSKPQTQYTVDPTYTFLKNQYGTNTLRIDFKEFDSSTASKTAFCEKAVMKINGQDFGTMKSMGFAVNTYFDFELTDLSVIKDVILEDNLNIELTEPGSTTSFTIKNELTPEQRQEIAGKPVEPETDTVTIGDSQAVLLNSKDHNEESMSGPTMKHEAQFITDANGDTTVILHFAPAVIMGITAYATDLSLADCDTQFVLRDDNSGICIVKIPAFTENEQIISGHIFSSVMHSDVALKITKPTQSASLKEALKEKVTEIQTMLEKDEFYESTKEPVLKALEAAKNPQDVTKAYTDLLKAAAGLRKIVEDPFTGDTVFHMEASDTSTIARRSLGKYVKVEIVDGKKMLTAHYNSYLDFDGLIYMDSVQVLDQEGKEIPSTYTLDENKNGTLTFEMTYIPSSGIYDVVLGNGSKPDYNDNKFIETKLCMDYATIVKGPFKALLQEAIDQYGCYTAPDYSGTLPMENRKGDFTENSWSRFEQALNQCREDLKAGTLTQKQIEESVNNLKEARLGLVYRIKAGSGNTANVGASVLNNPSEPYYSSDPHAEYPEIVGWAGSKVIFGADGAVYRVLDNTLAQNADGKANGGKLLLMAETARVKQPFTPTGDPSVRWNNSALRDYMNGEFYQNNFSDVERSAILKTTIETYDYQSAFMGYPTKNPDTRIETEDFIFAPGMDIVTSERYGYGSNDSRIAPAYYALRNVMQDDFDDYVVVGVDPKGRVGGRFILQSREMETPACMYLDAGKILMTVNAATGIPEKVTAVDALESNLWKLVLQDDALKLNGTYRAQVNGNTVAIDMGAYNGQLMAVVIEGNDFASGTVKAYGKVDASGFQLSSFDTATEKLYVMAIRDEDGKTAYASQPALVKIDKNIEPSTPDQPEFNKGTVTITMNKDGEQNPSMCDPMFAEKAGVEIHGENAVLKLYVAYPIPGFPNLGTDGTLKNFTISYGGKEYVAKSDITSKPTMTVKADNPGFGLVKGDEITAQVLTVELPKAALNEQYLDAKAYVNVVMNMDVQFDMVLSNLVLDEMIPEPEKPDQPEFNKGTVTITMNKDGEQNPSMCDPMFAEKAGVEIYGENAVLKLYVAYPIPGFPNLGTDGTLKNFTISYGGKEYVAKSDITSKPTMTVKADNPGFGLVKGDDITAQVLTVGLPKAALNEQYLDAKAYVNVVMNMDVQFDMVLSDLVLNEMIPEPEKPQAATADPAIAPNGGTFKDSQKVTLSCKTEGAVIYYTTDGSVPTEKSTKYTEPFTLTETTTVKAVALAEGMKMSAVVSAEFTKDAGNDQPTPDKPTPDKPTPDEGKIADGSYHVNAALWHATSDQASMGDAAFEANRKALVTVKDGKVTTVQLATGPVHMGPIVSAIVEVTVDGQSVEVLKTQKLTTEPAGNEIEYIQQFSFQLPDSAQPAALEGVTYVPVQFKVPDTPMGDNLMSARIKLDWSTAVKTEEGEVPQPTVPEKPDSEQIVVDQEDKDTGIKVHADKGVFTEKVQLIVNAITEGKIYERAAKALSSVGKKFKLYEIHFENENGEEVQPNGKATVSYKIPEGYNASKLALYRINDDGTKTLVNGTVKDGYYEVVQKHFSTYALVEVGSKTADSGSGSNKKPSKPKAPNTGDEASVTAFAALFLVASAGVVMVLNDKKRKEEN